MPISGFKNLEDGFVWVFIGVYGPILGREKKDLWDELGAIRGMWDDPCCVGGDFNTVRFLGERRNDFRFMAEMRRFTKVIEELILKDLPLSGSQFTWCRGINSEATSRLDRFLVTDEWKYHFL